MSWLEIIQSRSKITTSSSIKVKIIYVILVIQWLHQTNQRKTQIIVLFVGKRWNRQGNYRVHTCSISKTFFSHRIISNLFCHSACLQSWLEQHTSCPTCRTTLSIHSSMAAQTNPPDIPDTIQPARRQLNHFFHFDGKCLYMHTRKAFYLKN